MEYFNKNNGSCLGFFEFSRTVGPNKIKQLANNTEQFINSDLHVREGGIYFDRQVKKYIASRVYSGNFFASGDTKLDSELGPDFKILLKCVPKKVGKDDPKPFDELLPQLIKKSDYDMLLSTYNRGIEGSAEEKKIDKLTHEALYKLFVDERYTFQNQNGAFTRPLGTAFECVCEVILDSCIPKNKNVEIRYQCKAIPGGEKMDAIVLAKSKFDLSKFFFNLSKTECVSIEEFN